MEVESQPSGGAGDAPMAPPSNTWHIYQRLPATYSFESTQTPGSPRSTHTDTDTAMEMGGLSVAPGGPDLHHITPRASIPMVTQRTMSTPDLAATVARGVAAATMQILERFTRLPQVNEADCPPVDLGADAAIRECFQRCLATTPQATSTGPVTTGRTSAFDRLGHLTPDPQEEGKWMPHPEMMPRKIDRGRQPHKEQETLRYYVTLRCFALQIVAIANWGRKYMDMGFKYPIPMFPPFLFTPYRSHTRVEPKSPSSRPR